MNKLSKSPENSGVVPISTITEFSGLLTKVSSGNLGLPSEMSKRAVGFCHLVRILFLLYSISFFLSC